MTKRKTWRVLLILLLIILIFGCSAFQDAAAQTKYYVSSSAGNDVNDGRSPNAAWQSLDKVSTASSAMVAADTIFFKRDDIFPGSVIIRKGGSSSAPIVLSAYGTGSGNPVLSGLVTLTGWTNSGGNIWWATPAKVLNKDVNVVTINGVPQAVGRTNWMVYQSATPTQLTSLSISGGPSYIGAEICMRKNTFVAERATVTGQSGSTITYANDMRPITNNSKFALQNGTAGMGFFFQRFIGSLDRQGEWFFDKTANRMNLYSTTDPTGVVVKASFKDTVITVGTRSNVVIENLTIEGGNIYGVEADQGTNVQVKNCKFFNNTNPVYFWNVNDALVQGNTILYSLSRGILVSDNQTKRIQVLDNFIWNTGQLIGNAIYNHEYSMRGIVARTSEIALDNYVRIIGNVVKLTGNGALQFQGSHALVRRNWTDSMNNQLDDNGGIYTFVNNQSLNNIVYTDRVIDSNIVSNSLGAPLGSNGNKIDVVGIYLDDQTPDVIVRHNTVINVPGIGIQLNNVKNVTVEDNTVYNCDYAIWVNRKRYGSTTNNLIRYNILYGTDVNQRMLGYTNSGLANEPYANINAALQGFATMDGNHLRMGRVNGFYRYYAALQGGSYIFPTPDMTLKSWQDNSFHDLGSDTVSTVIQTNFYVNPSSQDMMIVFDGFKKKDVYGNSYQNYANVPRWSSLILLADGTATPPEGNQLPQARANNDTTIRLPSRSILLDGSLSSDPDGRIVSWYWEVFAGPDGSVLTTPNQPTTQFKNLVLGDYAVRLHVTDDMGGTAVHQVNLSVLPKIPVNNVPPTVLVEGDTTLAAPANSTYMTAIVNDVDGSIASSVWTQTGGAAADIESSTTPNTWIRNLSAGTSTFELTVTDNSGAVVIRRVRVILTP